MVKPSPRVLVLAHDSMWPENHGYRIDVARRLRKLEQLGFDVGLVTLSRESGVGIPRNESPEAGLRQHFIRGDYVPSLIAMLSNPKLPWPAAARSLPDGRYQSLAQQIKKFSPASIIVEGLYSFELARRLSIDVMGKLPIIYRSHNVEHTYMMGQLHAAKGARSVLNLALSVKGLERFELDAIRASKEVLDISWEDAEFWRAKLARDVRWVPPLPGSKLVALPGIQRWDFAYCGNLNAPNNVEAIGWFVREVWPIYLRECDPRAKLVLAGSRPSSAVQQICNSHVSITLLPDPPSMQEVYLHSRALINPALSGSGVNIKTIDMIFSSKPLVVSKAAVKGLPPFVTGALGVATGVSEWIAAMQMAMDAPSDAAQRLAEEYSDRGDRAYAELAELLR